MDQHEIERRFTYWPPDEPKQNDMAYARSQFKLLATVIANYAHAGREQSLAVTALEESQFWFNAAVARPFGQ